MTEEEAVALFEKSGSYCRTGNGTTFCLEIFSTDQDDLTKVQQLWGGHVYKPSPASPKRWVWRLYGKAAQVHYDILRPLISEGKQARGDRKRKMCEAKYGLP